MPSPDGSNNGGATGAQPLTYSRYLRLSDLLSAQRPLSRPEHHDELLFIIQHQTAELWMKLVIHELRAAIGWIQRDQLEPTFKILARVKHIQAQLFNQWSVLETLTPPEYAQFRGVLGTASGFQSHQYRAIEFLLGAKDADAIERCGDYPDVAALLNELLRAPSLYDEFLRSLARSGRPIPADIMERDWTRPRRCDERVVAVFQRIYEAPERNWDAYEMAEKLVDVEESFQLWRTRHLLTVRRIIGMKPGTGGTSGARYLADRLAHTFFPELWEVRTRIGASGPDAGRA